MPGRNGGTLLVGGDGVSGGRPPDEFKRMCRELVTRDETWQAVQEILKDKGHPHYMSALKWAAEHGYGKPVETVNIDTPKDGTLAQLWSFGQKKVAF